MIPIVYRQLARAGAVGRGVPESVIAELREIAAGIAKTNLRVAGELSELARAAEMAGIPMIAYKGPVLASRAYGDLSLRHFADLDVLVRASDLMAMAMVLHELGYAPRLVYTPLQQRALRRWGHHESWTSRHGTLLEVHWQFSKPVFGFSPRDDEIWASSELSCFGVGSVRMLSPTYELLVVAAHGTAHGWKQLSWLCDVAALSVHPDLDVGVVLDRARELHCIRAVALALYMAHTRLGVPLAEAVRAMVSGDDTVRNLAAIADRLMFGEASGFAYASFQLPVRDSRVERLRFLANALFRPTPADAEAVRLPGLLYPLYFIVRPIRIALKYRPRRPGTASVGTTGVARE